MCENQALIYRFLFTTFFNLIPCIISTVYITESMPAISF